MHFGKFQRLGLLSILLTLVLTFTITAAQTPPALAETAALTEGEWTISLDHPTSWVSLTQDNTLYLANSQESLDVLAAGKGLWAEEGIGFIVFAPSAVDALELPADADSSTVLKTFVESMALGSPSDNYYNGDPAIGFNLFGLNADGTMNYEQRYEMGSIDALAYEREGRYFIVFQVTGFGDFDLTEAVKASFKVTTSGTSTASSETNGSSTAESTPEASGGPFTYESTDEDQTYTFSVDLPAGWQALTQEEMPGAILIASSADALATAQGAMDALPRGDSVLYVFLPAALRLMEVNPLDTFDTVFANFATALEFEAYAVFVEGFSVQTATATILNPGLPEGVNADLYTFGYPEGAVVAIVVEILGSSNPDTRAVLESLSYAAKS